MAERSNAQIYTGVTIAIVLGAIVSWAGSDGGDRVGTLPVFALCGALAFGINWLAFVPAALTQTEHYYDLVGGITYISVTVSPCSCSGELDLRAMLVAAMVMFWSLGSQRSCSCASRRAAVTIVSTTSRIGRRVSSWHGPYRACGCF